MARGYQPVLFRKHEVESEYDRATWFRQPAIVPPIFFKEVVVDDPDDPRRGDGLRRIIRAQWDFAEQVLKRARKVVFIGYGFPATDEHALEMLKRSIPRDARLHVCDLKETMKPKKFKAQIARRLGLAPKQVSCSLGGFEKSVKEGSELFTWFEDDT